MSGNILTIRPTELTDLEDLFRIQMDAESRHMAAFVPESSSEWGGYFAKYSRLVLDPDVSSQTMRMDEAIIGSLSRFEIDGEAHVSYWIDRSFWGRGITTRALQMMLFIETARPMYARVAFDNVASQRVLEKCGFFRYGKDRGFAHARGEEIEEWIYRLDTHIALGGLYQDDEED